MHKKFFSVALLAALMIGGLASCNNNGLDVPDANDGSIRFGLAKGSEFAVLTKATTPGTSITSFKAAATTGTAGSESAAAWNNVAFTDDGTETNTYKASPAKYWPVSNPSYNFYAVGASEGTAAVVSGDAPDMAFAAGGTTITMAAGYDKDVVCAYFPYAADTYKEKNGLAFKHIFARVAGVTVTAGDECAISNVSISIVNAKTGGVYNLRTGANQSDGTGWSDMVPASGDISVYSYAGSIASAGSDATGSVFNDSTGSLYLVPGAYYLKATWTASVDDYTQTYSAMTTASTYNFVGGSVNTIACTLTGDPSELTFSITLTAWGSNSVSGVVFPHS